jgi:small-conductance mechanosensitive channel
MIMGLEGFARAVKDLTTVEDIQDASNILKNRLSEIERVLAVAFGVGDTVSFTARKVNHTGVIEKINAKSITVNVSGRTWTVAPSYLTKVVDITK